MTNNAEERVIAGLVRSFSQTHVNRERSNYVIRRIVGGGFLDSVKSALGWIKGKLPAIRGVLENVQNPYAQAGATVLKTLGYGQGHKAIDNRLA